MDIKNIAGNQNKMSIVIQDETQEFSLIFKGFDKNTFLFNDPDDTVKAEFKYSLDIDKMNNIDDYELHLLYNKNFAENNIFEAFDGDIRLGWIFPLQALISKNHDYAGNKHFLNYAYVAFLKLLIESKELGSNKLNYREDCTYRLEDLYDIESTHVFITSNSNCEQISGYDFQRYIASLYDLGYLYTNGNHSKEIDGNKKLKLNKLSDELSKEVFIKYLFTEILVDSIHHLVKFYMLYQVIELLIENIFNSELQVMLDGLSKDEKNLFQVKEDLGNLAKENERIKRLFNRYSTYHESRAELMNLCNILLENVGREKKGSPEKALYSVRNLYVHDFRSIPTEYESQIEQINIVFEKVIIETIHTFNLTK